VSRVASREEAQAIADYMWSTRLRNSIGIELDVIDYDRFINPMDRVELFVFVGPHSSVHYSSGLYYAESVTDSIKGGHLHTSLSMRSLLM
jgi:hypothetical protein